MNILKLYPGQPEERPLRGTYLAHELHRQGTPERPFVYGNFVSSLDGRIAIDDPHKGSHVPLSLTSGNDFRLFLELQAQADCLISHGGYMRAIAAGMLDDILQVGALDGTDDLAQWRTEHGLAPQPALVIASATLDFSVPESTRERGQTVYIATGRNADPERARHFQDLGYEVIVSGAASMVEGAPLIQAMAARGYRSYYLLAGPRMLHAMLRDRQLSRLYLTVAHLLVGGEGFHTLTLGPEFEKAGRMRMMSLYYDASSPKGAGQWFAQFEAVAHDTEIAG